MRTPALPRHRHAAAPLLHWLLVMALTVQAVVMVASAAAGMAHRHSQERADAPAQQVLVDFRRSVETVLDQGHAHAEAARHHHGPSVADVVRTPQDQADDRSADAATDNGLSAHLALLPGLASPAMPMATPPQVDRPPWMATTHQPALPKRPPRTGALRTLDA